MTIGDVVLREIKLLSPEPADVIVFRVDNPTATHWEQRDQVYDFLRDHGVTNPIIVCGPDVDVEAVHIEELLRRAMENKS